MLVVQSCARTVTVPHAEELLVSGTVLEGGTLTSSAAGFGRSPVRRHLGGVWNTDRTEYGVVGTLLGPERAGNRFFSDRAISSSYRCAACGCAGSGGGR